jgi:uncharacterized membrane protein
MEIFFNRGIYMLKFFLLPTPIVVGNKQEYFIWYILKLHWVLFLFFVLLIYTVYT